MKPTEVYTQSKYTETEKKYYLYFYFIINLYYKFIINYGTVSSIFLNFTYIHIQILIYLQI